MGRTPKFTIIMAPCPNGCHPLYLLESGKEIGCANPRNKREVFWAFMVWFRQTRFTWKRCLELMSIAMDAVDTYNARLAGETQRLVIIEVGGGRTIVQREVVR